MCELHINQATFVAWLISEAVQKLCATLLPSFSVFGIEVT